MMRFDDRWVWDSWPLEHGGQKHLFFLQAPRSIEDPDARHFNVSIGHAVSSDWRTWTELPLALAPSEVPSWDDAATWTGSVVQGPTGRFHLFYTGASHADGRLVQRIGRADSDDLVSWERFGSEALVEADPRWYEKYDGESWHDEAWRDPWVFADPDGDGWHMYITARSNQGELRGRGVLGHAWSADLENWEVRPPLSSPAGFGHLEVSQYYEHEGHGVLLFSCNPAELQRDVHLRHEEGGVWLVPDTGHGPLGPWDLSLAEPISSPPLYAAHLIDDGGQVAALGFNQLPGDAELGDQLFSGLLMDPVPVTLPPAERVFLA